MNKKEMETWTKSVQEKLGKDASGKIADELGKLITDNAQMLDIQEKQIKQIENLKQDKENLLAVNGNLLQQVAMGEEEPNQFGEKEKEAPKIITYKDCFDEKGNFKI